MMPELFCGLMQSKPAYHIDHCGHGFWSGPSKDGAKKWNNISRKLPPIEIFLPKVG